MGCNTCKEPNIFKKAWSFLVAMCSKKDPALGIQRIMVCRTYNKNTVNGKIKLTPCEYYNEKGERAFCNACFCPQSGPLAKFSNLEYKTQLTKASCPEDRW